MSPRRVDLPHWCVHLRWKSHDADQHDAVRLQGLWKNEGELCTCLRTAQEVGFDDELVSMRGCDASRVCYEADPRLVRIGADRVPRS